MTVLGWNLSADRIEVTCDTLSVNQDFIPCLFTSKVVPVPHLGVVIGSTGNNDLVSRWTLAAQTVVQARGLDDLDGVASHYLRRLHDEVAAEWPDHEIQAVVYHFGRSEKAARFVGRRYSSSEDYSPEQLPDGLAIVPGLRSPIGDGPHTLADVAKAVRNQQLDRPPEERAHIGGELVTTVLMDKGMATLVDHRFPDYDEHWRAMRDLAEEQHAARHAGP